MVSVTLKFSVLYDTELICLFLQLHKSASSLFSCPEASTKFNLLLMRDSFFEQQFGKTNDRFTGLYSVHLNRTGITSVLYNTVVKQTVVFSLMTNWSFLFVLLFQTLSSSFTKYLTADKATPYVNENKSKHHAT
jgi:hypothetical protein